MGGELHIHAPIGAVVFFLRLISRLNLKKKILISFELKKFKVFANYNRLFNVMDIVVIYCITLYRAV